MTYLEFFAELLSEMTGISKKELTERMKEYDQHFESNNILYKEISKGDMDKMRNAARSDPQGFLMGILAGQKDATMSRIKFN